MPRIPAGRTMKPEPIDEPALPVDQPSAVAVAEPPQTPRPEPHPAAAAVVARRADELAAAEQLLRKELDGRPLTPDEDELLRHLFPGQFQRQQELRRVARYRQLQLAAGSPADRDLAGKKAAATAEKLATEGAVIRAKIDSLQADLAALERAAADAASEQERRAAAVAQLADTTLLPEPSRSRYRFSRERWEKDFGIPVRSKRQEAKGCLQRVDWTVENDSEQITAYCQAHKNPDVRAVVALRFDQVRSNGEVKDRRRVTINAMLWHEHTLELRDRAERLTAEADALEQAGELLKRELDSMLETLIPK